MSFHREKYVPRGGPDGGDGGPGGDVIILARPNLADLGSIQRKREFVAEDGHGGAGWRRRGKKGEDLIISVPIGTEVITKARSGEDVLVADLMKSGERIVVAKGGRGGLGNARYATAVNQAPDTAGNGTRGQNKTVVLEVKLITDMCIVGPPNSGKSTFLARISGAKPEIADYPFTTRQPVLGTASDDRRDFVLAEMPALVKDAHLGRGLGNEFLRHAERTRLLIYFLDASSPTIATDFTTLEGEIALYKGLSQKKRIVVVNKIDLPEVQAKFREIKEKFPKLEVPVFYVSALTGEAVLELATKAMEIVDRASPDEEKISQPSVGIFRPKPKK